MSTVLVIEPRRILQHAATIALFPDHEARVVDAIPDAGAALLEQCDAVIVDAMALREVNALPTQALSAMEAWTLPMVWIDSDTPQPPKCVNLAIVKRPVSRDELRTALATCLGRELMARTDADAAPAQRGAGSAKTNTQKAAASAEKGPKVIELVEVVEEVPPAQRKSKK